MSNYQRDDDGAEYMEEDVDDHEMQDDADDMDDEFRGGGGASDSDVEEFDYSVITIIHLLFLVYATLLWVLSPYNGFFCVPE